MEKELDFELDLIKANTPKRRFALFFKLVEQLGFFKPKSSIEELGSLYDKSKKLIQNIDVLIEKELFHVIKSALDNGYTITNKHYIKLNTKLAQKLESEGLSFLKKINDDGLPIDKKVLVGFLLSSYTPDMASFMKEIIENNGEILEQLEQKELFIPSNIDKELESNVNNEKINKEIQLEVNKALQLEDLNEFKNSPQLNEEDQKEYLLNSMIKEKNKIQKNTKQFYTEKIYNKKFYNDIQESAKIGDLSAVKYLLTKSETRNEYKYLNDGIKDILLASKVSKDLEEIKILTEIIAASEKKDLEKVQKLSTELLGASSNSKFKATPSLGNSEMMLNDINITKVIQLATEMSDYKERELKKSIDLNKNLLDSPEKIIKAINLTNMDIDSFYELEKSMEENSDFNEEDKISLKEKIKSLQEDSILLSEKLKRLTQVKAVENINKKTDNFGEKVQTLKRLEQIAESLIEILSSNDKKNEFFYQNIHEVCKLNKEYIKEINKDNDSVKNFDKAIRMVEEKINTLNKLSNEFNQKTSNVSKLNALKILSKNNYFNISIEEEKKHNKQYKESIKSYFDVLLLSCDDKDFAKELFETFKNQITKIHSIFKEQTGKKWSIDEMSYTHKSWITDETICGVTFNLKHIEMLDLMSEFVIPRIKHSIDLNDMLDILNKVKETSSMFKNRLTIDKNKATDARLKLINWAVNIEEYDKVADKIQTHVNNYFNTPSEFDKKLLNYGLKEVVLDITESEKYQKLINALPIEAKELITEIENKINFCIKNKNILSTVSLSDAQNLLSNNALKLINSYLSISKEHREELISVQGKTPKELLLDGLNDVTELLEEKILFINESNLSELSVARRITREMRSRR